MEHILRDVRYAVRVLVAHRGFTILAIICLALGIGATAAIFSVVNGVLLSPLPFPAANRLIAVGTGDDSAHATGSLSAPDFVDYRAGATRSELAVWGNASFNFRGSGAPERLRAASISANFFHVLGVAPVVGRAPLAEEELPQRNREAVLSYALWQREFGGDPKVVGRTIRLDAADYSVIGVMPKGFDFPITADPAQLWVPLTLAGDSTFAQSRGAHFLRGIGRLKPGATVAQAQAELRAIARRLSEQYPASNQGFTAAVEPLQENLVGGSRIGLLVLAGATGFLLLIACANVANLMLAHSTLRTREVAVRTALGATRATIVRQLLVESVLLALAGGVVGLILASWGTELLLGLAGRSIPRLGDVTLDGRVVAFTALVSIVTGLLFGLVPALQVTSTDLNSALKEGGRSMTGPGSANRMRSALVTAEVALSLMLLAGAGLLSTTLVKLMQVNPGFDARNVLTTSVSLSSTTYDTNVRQIAFFRQLLDRARSIPGVTNAGAVTILPMSGGNMVVGFALPDEPHGPNDAPKHAEQLDAVMPDYFRTVGIPLRAGREFTTQDDDKAPWVMIVSQSFAQKLWPGQNPMGKRAYIGAGSGFPMDSAAREVVGVVGNVRRTALDKAPLPQIYIPEAQLAFPQLSLMVRTRPGATNVAGDLHRLVIGMDPDQAISPVRPLESVLSLSLARQKFSALLLGIFAAAALALSAVGIYGVMMSMVTQRRRELAVRMALGARPADVLRLVVKHGVTLAALGVAVGLAGALALSRFLSSLLYGVKASDPVTLAVVSIVLAGVALLASYLPARRATRVDPAVVLGAGG